MDHRQKIALIVATMAIGAGSMALRNYLFGTFNMGSRVGTIGRIAIFTAFLFGLSFSHLYPETALALLALFGS